MTARWLLINFRSGDVIEPYGIVLYDPDNDSLLLRFRNDMIIDDPDGQEIVALFADWVHSIAVAQGAMKTFEWMADTLSLAIFAEGPYDVTTTRSEALITELFLQHCRPRGQASAKSNSGDSSENLPLDETL